MAKPVVRIVAIEFALGLAIIAVLARAAQLQLVQGDQWAAQAAAQRTAHEVLPARRGTIYDRNGVPLAVTQEFFHVGIAPNEVTDRAALVRVAGRSLGVSAAQLDRSIREGKRYVYFHGPFTATQVDSLRDMRGVHLEGEFLRYYPSRDLARAVIGRFGEDTTQRPSGLELSLDSILTGTPGAAVVLKDQRGQRYDSPARVTREPVAGNDVVLTLDVELQEIAERGLDQTIEALDADGGDVVFLDPASGELLALASRQAYRGAIGSFRASTFTDSYEPGSTAKLFTAASLLMHHAVDSTDTVNGEDGRWTFPVNSRGKTRTITDAHVNHGRITLAQAIQVSSNIGMAKFSERLTPEQQYETLRDFGFGTPTGTEFPSESRGRLERPDRWLPNYNGKSMAMGYAFDVTPVQLAAAYGAIADDGLLLTPTLVREIRDPEGELLYQHQPEPVRRAVTPDVAARLRQFLAGAAGEGGTGEKAQLLNYTVLGKTGTALRNVNGRYVAGTYTASFAALFPADHPQLVVIVKIDNPKTSYYGASAAAPLTHNMLEQALAAQHIPIDRVLLASGAPGRAAVAPPPPVLARNDPARLAPVVRSWPLSPSDVIDGDSTAVPAVVGTSVRQAALALHRRGFRVAVNGLVGNVARSEPAAGASAVPGTVVTLWTDTEQAGR